MLPEIALIKKGAVRRVLIRPFFIGVKTGSKRTNDSKGNSVTSEGVELLVPLWRQKFSDQDSKHFRITNQRD